MKEQKSVVELVQERMAKGDVFLPVFDRTALKIQKELAKEDPDMQLVERMITVDPAMAGQVLRLANSSFFKGLTKVASVRNAIVRLGVKEVSNIVAMVSHRRYFISDDPFIKGIMDRLWRHSVGCAIGCHWIAQKVRFEAPLQEAFFAGLLHDVGKLFILIVLREIRKEHGKAFLPSEGVVDEVFSSLHCELGFNLMQQWNLPDAYATVARDHHQTDLDPQQILLAVVRVADKACNKIGIGLAEDPGLVLTGTPEVDLLGLSDIEIARLEIHLEDSRTLAG